MKDKIKLKKINESKGQLAEIKLFIIKDYRNTMESS